jgi:hypothetical protein
MSKNLGRLLRSLLSGVTRDVLVFFTLIGITAVAAALALLATQQRDVEEPEHSDIATIVSESTEAPPPTPPISPPPDLSAAILLEDAFAALRPYESIGVAELRGRLVERGSEEAEMVDLASLRNLLTTDSRFRVDSRALVRLTDLNQRNSFEEKGREL